MTQATRSFIDRIMTVGGLALALLVSFVTFSYAAGSVTPEDGSLLDQARPIFETLVAGHYLAGAALALAFAIAAARRYAPGRAGAFLKTNHGGALAALGISFFGACATSLAAYKGFDGFSWAMVLASGKIAAMGAGGYVLIKHLIVDPFIASSWYAKSPAWVKAGLKLVLWMFDNKAAAAETIKEAEQAGEAAVKANPSGGTDSPSNLGKPEQF